MFTKTLSAAAAASNGTGNDTASGEEEEKIKIASIKEEIRIEIYTRIRFYACPLAVIQARTLGRGFLFIQSPSTLIELSFTSKPLDKDKSTGRMFAGQQQRQQNLMSRSMILHYLTVGEYDAEVCKDDFELALVRKDLQQCVHTYDE